MNPEDVRIHDLVVEACALTQRLATETPVDERAWATLHHLRVALCMEVEHTDEADTRDAARGAISEIDRVGRQAVPARWERGAA
ncbi:MAG: hypothetical protein M3493_00890 [Actinomycetota bacterium]|jgi:hypothetical protein|nr:hypothetical protein [Actinomycetota bacterium]